MNVLRSSSPRGHCCRRGHSCYKQSIQFDCTCKVAPIANLACKLRVGTVPNGYVRGTLSFDRFSEELITCSMRLVLEVSAAHLVICEHDMRRESCFELLVYVRSIPSTAYASWAAHAELSPRREKRRFVRSSHS